ncbi:MAG: DUF4349 domain-containing protein [Chitinophagaceae bacterium]|nr:DUF4349 domain-containing protein [Chitinophagaceae bacterium]
MTVKFKSRLWSISKWFGGLFLLLFIFRFVYGFYAIENNRNTDFSDDFFGSLENIRKNYASEKNFMKMSNAAPQPDMASNQKFEKTASVKSKSSEFEKDENSIKSKANAFGAVIQYEQKLGQKGNRQLHLLIGVNPALFDSFYTAIQKIGVIKASEITKVDKTNEYKQLNAKKLSLEKTLQSLLELKSKSGQIADYITLHDKILEIEGRLQELGVELGNFDEENEFCTVKLSLYEGATEKNISMIHRLKVALQWTIHYYAVLVLSILGVVIISFLLLLIVDRLKIMKVISGKMNE